MAPRGAHAQRSQARDVDGGGLLTGEGGDVVIVLTWRCCVGSDVSVFVFASVERIQSLVAMSVSPDFCSRQSCSALEEGNLDFMFPPVLEGLRWHLLPVAARRDVCCVLQGFV